MGKIIEDRFQITFDSNIPKVLHELKASVAISTYQAGRIVVIGSHDGEKLHQIPVPFKRPMGIALEGNQMVVACLEEVHFLANNDEIAQQKKVNKKEFDAFFVHRATYNTATIDVHDIALGNGKLWAVNTAFSCLCTLDLGSSFNPKWKPGFISELVPEDRCHLNGMAVKEGLPRYVTALGASDSKEGWRQDLMKGGILMAVPSGDIIIDGLAMPHSPRYFNDELYLLTSGDGKLLKVDETNKTFEVIYEFGQFIRGLDFIGKYAFIGMSQIRQSSKSFSGLEVADHSKNAGVILFDMEEKVVVGKVLYHSTVEEIYDVKVIPGYQKPAIITQQDERSQQIIYFANQVFWRKPKEKNNDNS